MSETGETLTIVGTCGEISERNGWTAFAINVEGKQYPIKLSTKLPALIEKGRAMGTQVATWSYKESQGGENPNKPGTFYTNRYFEGVEPGGEAAPAGGSSPAPVAHHDPIAQADRDRAISRMSCLSSAATLLQGVSFEGEGQRLTAWLSAARAAEVLVYRDIDPDVVPDDDPPF